ncbi:hypothetical protein [Bacillus paranthracis]|uniref:hypothetical protein n=1 Tax=Bacillus paranthracis TaxID=2026186 RepID=UPI0022E90E02|nr:hypothetical protein [Bacillus paranthracis]
MSNNDWGQSKTSKFIFVFVSASYVLINGLIYALWSMEGLYSKKNGEGIKVIQDYLKTIAQTNLSVSLAIAALLIGVAALNYKAITEVISNKKEFLGNITALIVFVLLNFILLTLSYSILFAGSIISQMIIIILTCAAFIFLIYNIKNLIEITLGKVKKNK